MAANSLTLADAVASAMSAPTAKYVSGDERRAAIQAAFADGIRLAQIALAKT